MKWKQEWYNESTAHDATKASLVEADARIARIEALLLESYVFISHPHQCHAPWRVALDEWQAKVEAETGWNAYKEITKFFPHIQ